MMKFLVGESQALRHKRIREFLSDSTIIAVLLAAADFEWTVRRAIYLLGTRPIRELKDEYASSLQAYRKLWRRELDRPGLLPLEGVIKDWELLVDAFALRHLIIHGAQGTAGLSYASVRVERMLDASVKVAEYAAGNGANVFARLVRPRASARKGVKAGRERLSRGSAS